MKGLLYFVCGAAVGATVALLVAPEKGEVLRSRIREKGEGLCSKISEKGEEIRSRIRKVVDDDLDLGRELVAVVQDAVADTTNEVRQTIRKRK